MIGVCPPEKKKRMEKNKRTNANRDPEQRNKHYSMNVEVRKGEEGRLASLRSRLDHAKSLLGINRTTSSTQNADLLEQLLHYFELVRPSAVPASRSSVPASRSSSATSTFSRPSEPVQPPQSSSIEPENRRPQKRQIYVDAAVDDACFICTGESLKSLVKYFTINCQCEFCGGDYKWSGMSFSKQGHVCRLEVPCVCNDSVVWLSSGVLGHPAKYFANVK